MLAYLYEFRKIKGPHLIIAPKSTISNWMKEFLKWAPFLRIVNLIPTKEMRDEILKTQLVEGKFDVCVTTYEAINILTTALGKHKWVYIIFDEAHKLKNADSKISSNSRSINARRRLLLTGTPLQNNLTELWSLLNFLKPEQFANRDDFNKEFDFNNA